MNLVDGDGFAWQKSSLPELEYLRQNRPKFVPHRVQSWIGVA